MLVCSKYPIYLILYRCNLERVLHIHTVMYVLTYYYMHPLILVYILVSIYGSTVHIYAWRLGSLLDLVKVDCNIINVLQRAT